MPQTRNRKTVYLVLDDIALLIINSDQAMEKELFYYTAKTIESVKKQNASGKFYFEREVKRKKQCLFNLISEQPRSIQLHQGFWKRTADYLRHNNIEFQFTDNRTALPDPCFESMGGFRYNQKQLLIEGLSKACSGNIEAPTRYGKTYLQVNTMRAYKGLCTVIAMPGADLLYQQAEEFKKLLPEREIKVIGGGSRVKYQSEDITVCSLDSLHKLDKGMTELLLLDEPHAAVTDSRAKELVSFEKARKIGFSATLEGRFDGRDVLIEGIIGPKLAIRTYREAVEEGAICPIKVLALTVEIDDGICLKKRDAGYNKFLFRSDDMAYLTNRICEEVIPGDQQTIVFIQNEKQAEKYMDAMNPEAVIAMAKRMSKKEREATLKRMCDNDIRRCLASNIYVQGVTFHDLKVLINAAGGGSNTTTIQKPGRLAEKRPDKDCGVLIDFMFKARSGRSAKTLYKEARHAKGWIPLVMDSEARLNAYYDKGYEVYEVHDFQELKERFQQCMNP